jgi:hypothetical protein
MKIIRRICGPIFDADGLSRRGTNEEINTLLKQRYIVRYIKAERLAFWVAELLQKESAPRI